MYAILCNVSSEYYSQEAGSLRDPIGQRTQRNVIDCNELVCVCVTTYLY